MQPFMNTVSTLPGRAEKNGPVIVHRLKEVFIKPRFVEFSSTNFDEYYAKKIISFNSFEEYVLDFDMKNFGDDLENVDLQGFLARFWSLRSSQSSSSIICNEGVGWKSVFRGAKEHSQDGFLQQWLDDLISSYGLNVDLLDTFDMKRSYVQWFTGSTMSFKKWYLSPLGMAQIHYLHFFSGPRIWFGISSNDSTAFEALLEKEEFGFPSVDEISMAGINVKTIVQEPGTVVITSPGAYYAFVNTSFNFSESFLYGPQDWIIVANKHFMNAIPDQHEFRFHVSYEEIMVRVSQILHTFKRTQSQLMFCSAMKSLMKDIRVKEQIQRDIVVDSVQCVRHGTCEASIIGFCSSCKNRIYLSAVLCKCATHYLCLGCYLSEEHECNCKQSEKQLIFYKSTEELRLPSSILKWLQHYTRWRRKVSTWLDNLDANAAKSSEKLAASKNDDAQELAVDKEASKNKAPSPERENGVAAECEVVDEVKMETQSVLSESNEANEEVKSRELTKQKAESTKPSLEDLRSSLVEAKKNCFTADSYFKSLQALVQKATQFKTFVDCFLHPEKLKQENEKLLSSSLGQVYLTVTLDDLELASRCGESLYCRLDEITELSEAYEEMIELRRESIEFLEKANNDDDESCDLDAVNDLLNQWKRYPVTDNIVDELGKLLQRYEWLQRVNKLLESSENTPQSAHSWETVLFNGRCLPNLSRRVLAIYQDMSKKLDESVKFNDRAATILSHCRADSVNKSSSKKIEALLAQTANIPVNMPKVKTLRDVYEKVERWMDEVDVPCDGRQVHPFLSRLEKLCEEGEKLPLRLAQLPCLKTQVIAAQSWRDRASRFFMLKSTNAATIAPTLLQVLMPRSRSVLALEMNSGKSARRKRRGGNHAPSAQTKAQALDENSRRYLHLVDAVDLRNEVSMDATQERLLKVYKEMALSEYEGMMKLRHFNLEKAEKDSDDTVYCLCKRPDGSGFMLQCDLCKEWFHAQCISLPKKLQGKQGAKQEVMNKLVKDLKYLCPCCERSRRPTLDSVYSLLLALQKLPVRLVEGAALECLAERAVQWQDNIQGFLVSTTEIAKAFSCYCKSNNITLPDNLMHQLRLKLIYPDVDRPQTRSYLHSESGSHLHQLQNKMRAAMAASSRSDMAGSTPGAPHSPASSTAGANFAAGHSATPGWSGSGNRPNPAIRPTPIGASSARKHMRKTPLLPRSDSLEGHGLDSISHNSPINSMNGSSSLSSSPPHMVSSVPSIAGMAGVPGSNPYSASLSSSVMRGHGHGHGPGSGNASFPPLASRPQTVGNVSSSGGPQLHLTEATRRQMEDKLLEGDLVELQMDEKTWLWDMLCLSVPQAAPPSHPTSPINSASGADSRDNMDSPPMASPVPHRRISTSSNGPGPSVVSNAERVCVAPRVRAEREERLKKQRLQQWDLEHHGIAYSSSSSDSEMDLLRPSSVMRKRKTRDPGLEEEGDSDGSMGSDASPRRKVISFYRQGGVARPVFGTRRSSSSDSSFDIEKQLPSRVAMRKESPATAAYHTPRPGPGPRAKQRSAAHPHPQQQPQQPPHLFHAQHHALHYQGPAHHQPHQHPHLLAQHPHPLPNPHQHLHGLPAPRQQPHPYPPHQRPAPHHAHGQGPLPHPHHPAPSKHQQQQPTQPQQQQLYIPSPSDHKGAAAQQGRRLQEPMSPPTNPPPRRRRKNAPAGGPSGTAATAAASSGEAAAPKRQRHVAPERPPSSDDDSSSGGDLGDYKSGVCAVRYCEKPNAKVVQWIQCDNCQKWYHFQCIGLRNKMDAGQSFICLRCKQREANAHDKIYYGRR